MISLNAVCAKLLLSALHTKKEKDVINISKLRNAVETIPNNVFVIFVIFKNDAVSLQPNSTLYVAKTLVFKNRVLSMKKYHLSIHQKVNNLKLTYLKLYLYFYSMLCQVNTFYITRFFITKISY